MGLQSGPSLAAPFASVCFSYPGDKVYVVEPDYKSAERLKQRKRSLSSRLGRPRAGELAEDAFTRPEDH
jgi:hypothetical protein